MSAALAITPASGSITAKMTACRIDVTGAVSNDSSAYDAGADLAAGELTEPEIRYFIRARKSGTDDLRSHEFSTGDGKHSWYGVVFPSAGSWTVTLRKHDDTQVATLAVTVS